MTGMTQSELANWIALYAATGLCCGIALILSIIVTIGEFHRTRAWTSVKTPADALRLVPRTWWRWQRRYLLSTPVTLLIVGSFAATLSWT
ncbi:hypothetical protein E5A73_20065 [Sphingomonas gei]|uniref:Uncharacterized protein n=1 Tax=Sphingomonas gei TaxID=1395960 RepID=A0A4S1WZW5_9SPHN|nr:hypothetical protein [Sphingomonas gei]TGX49138.1 hypothetical protein E5A73_20065 [Sphingomonas gei]